MRFAIVLLVTLVGSLAHSSIGAEEAAAPSPRLQTLAIEAEMVVVSSKLALELIPALNDEATSEQTMEKLKDLLRSGEAKLVGRLDLKTLPDKKASAETFEELRYPTEFDPPTIPNNLPADPDKAIALLKAWPIVSYAPTAFETRNVGPSLEILPTITPAGLIHCEYLMQHVRFRRFNKYDAGVISSGQRLTLDQPIFHTCRSVGTTTVYAGEVALLGSHALPDDGGIELFLFRVTSKPKVNR